MFAGQSIKKKMAGDVKKGIGYAHLLFFVMNSRITYGF